MEKIENKPWLWRMMEGEVSTTTQIMKYPDCEEITDFGGDCCCNCKHRINLMCHPTNKSNSWWDQNRVQPGQGRITELFGYVCMGLHSESYPNGMFFEKAHGICEMHTRKTYKREVIEHDNR